MEPNELREPEASARRALANKLKPVIAAPPDTLPINRKGLHARATAKFVQCVDQFDAEITVTRCGETVNGNSIMGILTLGAYMGSFITITARGTQAEQALTALETLVAERFGESE